MMHCLLQITVQQNLCKKKKENYEISTTIKKKELWAF